MVGLSIIKTRHALGKNKEPKVKKVDSATYGSYPLGVFTYMRST